MYSFLIWPSTDFDCSLKSESAVISNYNLRYDFSLYL